MWTKSLRKPSLRNSVSRFINKTNKCWNFLVQIMTMSQIYYKNILSSSNQVTHWKYWIDRPFHINLTWCWYCLQGKGVPDFLLVHVNVQLKYMLIKILIEQLQVHILFWLIIKWKKITHEEEESVYRKLCSWHVPGYNILIS